MSDKISSWNVVHKFEKRSLLIAINCVAGLSILFFGYDQGMMAGVNNSKDYIDLMGFGHTEMKDGLPSPVVTDSLLQGGIVSVYYLGTLFGALLGGWTGDKVGRIKTIASGALWAMLGAALQCSAQNHNWMICGKLCLSTVPLSLANGAQHASSTELGLEFSTLLCPCGQPRLQNILAVASSLQLSSP